MKRTPVSRLSKGAIEGELVALTDELDQIDQQRAKIEDRRRQVILRGEKLGHSFRTMAPWTRMTGTRVHQIARGLGKSKSKPTPPAA